jgi:hypothetical protein
MGVFTNVYIGHQLDDKNIKRQINLLMITSVGLFVF